MPFSAPSIIIDLIVVALYFFVVVYVGLKFGERENTLESFALGGRAIPWLAVLASIIAAETSAATFLGTPGEGYQQVNYTFLQLVLGYIIGRLIVAFLFIKPFYDNHVYSIYEFLEKRFGRGTRLAASGIFLVTRVLASGARLYVAAIVLAVGYSLFTGHQLAANEQLVTYILSILAITLITALYTSAGGIKAVVWTDCIQSSVMIGGAIGAIVLLASLILHAPDGLAAVQHLVQHDGLPMITFGTVPGASIGTNILRVLTSDYTIWAGVIGMTFTTLATHGTDQDMVQRMLTASDYKKSRLSLVLSGLADLPIGFIFLTIGILLHIYYALNHDPSLPVKTNEIFVYFILKQMPAGLRGLLVAGIFATSMGSLSAALNALATSFTRDWYQTSHSTSELESVDAVRRFTYIFALLITVVASATAFFVIEHPDSRIIPIVLGIFGYTYGSLLGVFLLGLLTRARGTDLGNYIGMSAGFIVVALLTGLPNQMLEFVGLPQIKALAQIPLIAFPWRIMFGACVTFVIGALFKGSAAGEGTAELSTTTTI